MAFSRTHRTLLTAVAVASLGLIAVAESGPAMPDSDASKGTEAAATIVTARAALDRMAESDPMGFARMAIARYDRDITDYTCTLVMQERLDDDLTPVRTVECRYREAPRSVYMFWVKNPGDAKRALYMETPEFVEDGERVARVEPAGALIRLIVDDIKIPVNGKRAKSASRRTIDQFGFRNLFDLLVTYNTRAEKDGVLDYRYVGEGEIDHRPTYMFERKLPYRGEGGPYPDALLRLHIDQEWLLPTGLYSYADHTARRLLGKYEFINVKLNPGLTDADFKF